MIKDAANKIEITILGLPIEENQLFAVITCTHTC